jgi:hypothetical protein
MPQKDPEMKHAWKDHHLASTNRDYTMSKKPWRLRDVALDWWS